MDEKPQRSIAELFADDVVMGNAINAGIREALKQHAHAGNPVAVSRDGQVVWVSAQELLDQLPDEPNE